MIKRKLNTPDQEYYHPNRIFESILIKNPFLVGTFRIATVTIDGEDYNMCSAKAHEFSNTFKDQVQKAHKYTNMLIGNLGEMAICKLFLTSFRKHIYELGDDGDNVFPSGITYDVKTSEDLEHDSIMVTATRTERAGWTLPYELYIICAIERKDIDSAKVVILGGIYREDIKKEWLEDQKDREGTKTPGKKSFRIPYKNLIPIQSIMASELVHNRMR